MTQDKKREEKIREILGRVIAESYYNRCRGMFDIVKKIGKKSDDVEIEIIDQALKAILSLIPQPLSEEEVEKVLFDLYGGCHTDEERKDRKELIKAISTHFYKPRLGVEEIEKIIIEHLGRDNCYGVEKGLARDIYKAQEGR